MPLAPLTSFLRRAWQRTVRVSWTWMIRLFYLHRVENAPDWRHQGAVILAPNHTSFADPLFLQAAVPRHLRFMMTEAIYRVPGMKWFFKLWDAIPVPDGDAVKVAAMKEALRAVRAGQPLVIFPEGAIAQDGYLKAGNPGVVSLMVRTKVPVIPVAIIGAYQVFPYRANFPRAGRVVVRFGAPITAPEGELDREAIRRFTNVIMDAIHDLGVAREGEPLPMLPAVPVEPLGPTPQAA